MNENKQAEPVAQPYAYVYEFDSGMFGIHRSFSSNERNGSKPSRVVPVYTQPSPAVAVNEQLLEAAKNLESSAEECLNDDGFMAMVIPLEVYLELTDATTAAEAAKKGGAA